MRLIDAEKAYEEVVDLSGQASTKSAYAAFWKAGKIIKKLPTVDAVEVVRCKDCMYYDAKIHRCDHPNLNYDVECYDQWIDTEPDDFCSYGERRGGHEQAK